MHTRRIILLALTLFLVSSAAPQAAVSMHVDAAGPDRGHDTTGCTPHPPIQIVEDEGPQGFVLGGHASPAPAYRPGSGVVAGNGTEDDPYVIEGWCISTHGGQTGIDIRDTRAHVLIQANELSPGRATEEGLQHVPYLGLGLSNATNATVRGNRIAGHSLGGISAGHISNVTIERNQILDNRVFGVYLYNADANRVQDNLFRGNGEPASFQGPVASVYLGWSSANVVDSNTFSDNPSTAIRLIASDGNTLSANTIEGGDPLGIRLYHSHDNAVEDNHVTGTHWGGFWLLSAGGNRLTNNTLVEPGDEGVLVAGGAGNVLDSNHVVRPVWDGLQLGARNATLRGNVIEDPGHAGIQLWRSTGANLLSNRMDAGGINILGYHPESFNHTLDESNTLDGEPIVYLRGAEDRVLAEDVGQVIVVDSDNVTVRNQTIRNAATAVKIAYSSNTTVADSELSDATTHGLKAHKSPGTSVVRTLLEGARLEGAAFYYSPRASVEDSQARDNGRYGVYLYEAPRSSVLGNAVEDNGYEGVRVWLNSDKTRVENNTVRGHERYGIQSPGSKGVLVANNTVENNGKWGVIAGPGDRVVDNEIRGNADAGVRVSSSEATVTRNNIADNGAGIVKIRGAPVDATDNWWGCPQGPDHPDCDDAVGEVSYDPWLTEPNPTAGPA